MIFVFLILVFLRFVNIDKVPIFLDEAIYLNQANQIANGVGPLFNLEGTHLPVMIWVLSFINLTTGKFINLVYSGRVIVIIFDLLSAIFIYLIAKRLFDKQFGIVACIIYLSLPLNFFHSRFILLESLMNLFSVMALFLIINLRFGFALISSLILGFFTKPTILGSIIPFAFIPIFFSFNKEPLKKFYLVFFLVTIITLILFFPQSSKFGVKIIDFSQPIIEQFKLNLFKSFLWLRNYLTDLVVTFSLLAFLYALYKKNLKIVWFGIWAIFLILFLSFFNRHFYPRLLFSVSVPISILLSFGLWEIKKFNKNLFIVSVAVILFLTWRIDYYLVNDPQKLIPGEDRQQYFEDWTSEKGRSKILEIFNSN